jgi:hypothetical protein
MRRGRLTSVTLADSHLGLWLFEASSGAMSGHIAR